MWSRIKHWYSDYDNKYYVQSVVFWALYVYWLNKALGNC